MEEKINYSVIIPHFTRSDTHLLERCVASIPDREDVQILIVDNSPIEIDANLFQHRKNIQILYSEKSKGAGCARNVGLQYAVGKWLLFADSDDFFANSYWNVIDDILNKTTADIIYFNVDTVDSDTLCKTNRKSAIRINTLIKNFSERNDDSEDALRCNHTVPWGKVFRTSMVKEHSILFDEVPTSNDVIFSVIAGNTAREIVVSNELMYIVTSREGSLLTLKDKYSLRSRYEVAIRKSIYCQSIGKGKYVAFLGSSIKQAFMKYGFREGWWYINLLLSYHANPFWGLRKYVMDKLNH